MEKQESMNSSSPQVLNHVRIPISTIDENNVNRQDVQKKKHRHTCFEWIQLIATICIPVIIAIYTIIENSSYVSNAAESRRKDTEIARGNHLNDLEIAERSREKDRDLAFDQQQENILVEYQTFLTNLILNNGKYLNKSSEAKVVGYFKTLTALNQLTVKRKIVLIRSLFDAKLITLKTDSKEMDRGILDLRQLDLRDVTLGSPRNSPAFLRGYYYIEWRYLWLPESFLTNASFRHTRLECTTFSHSKMDSIDLSFSTNSIGFRCFDTLRETTSVFSYASMINATLYNSNFIRADFSSVNLTFANIQLFSCRCCTFWRANLFKANISSSIFDLPIGCGTSRQDFTDVKMEQAIAHSTKFHTINFDMSNWLNVQASKADIANCIFTNATMNNSSFVKSTIQLSSFQYTSLSYIDLSHAVLFNVTFIQSNMSNANLTSMKCNYCDFINVDFQGAILKNASFSHSNFVECRINRHQLEEIISFVESTFSNGTNQSIPNQEIKDFNQTIFNIRIKTGDIFQGGTDQWIPNKKIKDFNQTIFNIRIKTGDIFQGGTDADVYLVIFTSNIHSDLIQLQQADYTSDTFERGQIDEFTYKLDDLGKIESILIGHNENNLGDGWFLDWIEIHLPMFGQLYRFECYRWLDGNADDGKVERKLIPSNITQTNIATPYKITVYTGNQLTAGTDANVFLRIFGEKKDSDEYQLIKSQTNSNPFERNQKDIFQIQLESFGNITKIHIRHDNSGFGPSWYLDQIEIFDPSINQIFYFRCEQWLSVDTNDQVISKEIFSTQTNGFI